MPGIRPQKKIRRTSCSVTGLSGGFVLDDDSTSTPSPPQSITFTNVAPNPLPAPSYDCTETQVPGWLMTIGCTEDGVSNSTAQAPTAKIRVDTRENVICT